MPILSVENLLGDISDAPSFYFCADLFLTATFSQEFPLIPHAKELLKSMQSNMSFQSGGPLDDVITFLDRIENADPHSPDISDDDKNESWGHYQFTAATLTCTSMLISWDSIGNVSMACRLLAAAIKTCKVARHLCFSYNISPASYLSDVYLSSVVELLWRFWTESCVSISTFSVCTETDAPQAVCE
jgi:hypothetical protein